MDMMHGMQLYVRVVQAGSFSAAGRQVGLAPSSIFRHINALEEMLGTRLLNRTSRKLSLTEAGELYARRVENILAAIQDTNAEVSQLQSSPRGTLRVHCRVSLGAQHLAPVLPDFLARYPELRIDLQLADQPVDLVKENIDIAIMVGKIEDSSMIVRTLAISPRIVCASPSYLRRHAAPERPQDLTSHNCLTYRTATDPGCVKTRLSRGRSELCENIRQIWTMRLQRTRRREVSTMAEALIADACEELAVRTHVRTRRSRPWHAKRRDRALCSWRRLAASPHYDILDL